MVTACCLAQVSAQQSSFQWGFNDWTSTTLPQCQPLALYVNDAIGTVKAAPPYYLTVFEENGISTTSSVGSQIGSLSWTVNHLVGSRLVLTMFDSNGNSGGVLTEIYTVAGTKTGTNASCIPSAASPAISVTSNATSKINTCDLVQFSISGGKKPYTVSIAETNSEVPFNNTMGSNDNTYSWVNNLTPGNQVIVSVFDFNGNYGQSSQLMALSGSSNTHCAIASSSSSSNNNTSNPGNGNGKSGNSDQDNGGSGNNSKQGSSKTGIIAGVAIAAFFAIFFGLIAWFFLRRRQRNQTGLRESRRGWTIDRSDSVKFGGGRTRFPSDPNESDVTPFAVPPINHTSPPMSVHGYSDLQATPFMPDISPVRPTSQTTNDPRTTYYQDNDHTEIDEQDAYATDAFRMSAVGSSSGPSISSQAVQSSRGFRVINDDGNTHIRQGQSKGSLSQQVSAQPPRPVFQHEDAGIVGMDEIPPAYPGPGA